MTQRSAARTGVRPEKTAARSLSDLLPRSLWPLAAVIAVYVAAMFVIPTLAPVSISDDWTYVRSVEYLVNEGRIHILPVSAATMITQLFWGGLFGFIFGMSFGALRLSTIVITFLGALAVYGSCRELGVSRQRAALGMAVYVFNPVLYSISYTFMTDPHFLALLSISSYAYLRGLHGGEEGNRWTLLGSAVAALAVLQRPHGALIPFSVVLFLVGTRQLWWNRESLGRFLRIVAIPAATFLFYYLVVARGLPSQQNLFLDEARAAGVSEGFLLTKRIAIIEIVYIGFFLLPLALALVPLLGRLVDLGHPKAWLVVVAYEAILIGGAVAFWKDGKRMPYVPHFFGRSGPGAGDVRSARPPLAGHDFWNWFTLLCIAASFVAGLAVIRGFARSKSHERQGAGLFATILVFQSLGVIPQSLLFRNWIISLDRYLLPMTPFLIGLLLWATRHERIPMPAAWVITGAMALFSIAGTRDMLVFQSTVWQVSEQLNAEGVDNTRLDAGYPWDAYHLWEFGQILGITESRTPDGPWWVAGYAPATDSTYVVAGGRIDGYDVIAIRPYSSWLQLKHVRLYILRRQGFAGPP